MLEILKASRRRTILGTSLTVTAPTGQYSPDKLINLGTNRWTFKPEFAVSQPIGRRWLLDTYAGVWLFANNESAYRGTLVRTQVPQATFQAHLSYNFNLQWWAAFDATYYAGAARPYREYSNDDLQSNSRVGATLVAPVGQRHSMKFAVSRGAIVRYGANFSAFSLGWQTAWVPRPASSP
jgi:hypothetical protein